MPVYDDDARRARIEDLEEDTRDVRMALEIQKGLSPRELEFVYSIGRWVLDQKRVLTEKQRNWLDSILDKHVFRE